MRARGRALPGPIFRAFAAGPGPRRGRHEDQGKDRHEDQRKDRRKDRLLRAVDAALQPHSSDEVVIWVQISTGAKPA